MDYDSRHFCQGSTEGLPLLDLSCLFAELELFEDSFALFEDSFALEASLRFNDWLSLILFLLFFLVSSPFRFFLNARTFKCKIQDYSAYTSINSNV